MLNCSEKREFYRHPLHLSFTLGEAESEGAQGLPAAEARDISLGGLSFLSPTPLSAGSHFYLRIAVKERVYRLKIRVVYNRPEPEGRYRIGVAFSDCPMAFRAGLSHLFFEVYQYHRKLREFTDPSISEECAADRWLTENRSRFAA